MSDRNAREEVAYSALIFAVDALKGMGAGPDLPVMKNIRNALDLFTRPMPVTPIERGFVDAPPLTFRDFQAKNAARIPAFGMTLTHRTLMEWCCELAEETGEVCGVASRAGIDLELAVRQKWNNVSSRVSHPERI